MEVCHLYQKRLSSQIQRPGMEGPRETYLEPRVHPRPSCGDLAPAAVKIGADTVTCIKN